MVILVVYDGLGQARWASGTSGTAGAELRLQADGNMVVYNGAGEALWASYTPGTYENVWACGDFSCNGYETCATCSLDCGICPGGGGGAVVPLLSARSLVVLLVLIAAVALLKGVERGASS